jgi:hypothetical protein
MTEGKIKSSISKVSMILFKLLQNMLFKSHYWSNHSSELNILCPQDVLNLIKAVLDKEEEEHLL